MYEWMHIANRVLTSISNASNLDLNQETKEWIEAGSDISSRQKWTFRSNPRTLSESIANKPLDWSRAVNTTVNPNSANLLTNAYPIPLFAPVTIATESLDHHFSVVEGWDIDDTIVLPDGNMSQILQDGDVCVCMYRIYWLEITYLYI